MAKDPKKYPWIKSIFKKNRKNPEIIEGVYAGPDMFRNVDQKAPDAGIECVYAGPDMFGEAAPVVPETDQDAPEAEIEDVYAGPGIPPMALVYAGPDYFKRKAEDATPEDANAENNSENPEGLA